MFVLNFEIFLKLGATLGLQQKPAIFIQYILWLDKCSDFEKRGKLDGYIRVCVCVQSACEHICVFAGASQRTFKSTSFLGLLTCNAYHVSPTVGHSVFYKADGLDTHSATCALATQNLTCSALHGFKKNQNEVYNTPLGLISINNIEERNSHCKTCHQNVVVRQ